MLELNLKKQAQLIFTEALLKVDASAAVSRTVKVLDSTNLICGNDIFDLTDRKIYAIALGKAAYPMALALDDVLGEKLMSGIISGVLPEEIKISGIAPFDENKTLSNKWHKFAGGHPLPNKASLSAAQSCFNLLSSANNQQSLVIFLVSGGGSAMIEAPRSDTVTLTELRETNRLLVSCGATIAEINIVRRVVSLVKGGGLAARAPRADHLTLIVSDTEQGDEASVASGPSLESTPKIVDTANEIIDRYRLTSQLPTSVLRLMQEKPTKIFERLSGVRRHYVLLDNQSAVDAAITSAAACGFVVEAANQITQQPIASGCAELTRHITNLRQRTDNNRVACLISGGEFSCPVNGTGVGGRNSETALRMALMMTEANNPALGMNNEREIVFFSAGTDGIDGNSPAAGAISDETTLVRARNLNLDARQYLDNSDAYTFFHLLEDAIITGPTGTNVRDLRILLTS